MNDNLNNNMKRTNKSAKRKLLILIVSVLALIFVLFIASLIIDAIENRKVKEEYVIDYDFFPADYEENIYEDEKYLELISGEFIRYRDSATNITLGIDKDTAVDHGEEIEFIVNMLYDIINGDHVAYNANFSDIYYDTYSPKESFTMQKIYDVTITSISSEKATEDDIDYTKSIYCLEYKIYHNNGTFRRDIGDGSKKQYITLSNRSGQLLIDTVSTVIKK